MVLRAAATTHQDGRERVAAAAHRLTERDRSILPMLYRHRVCTTGQLAEVHVDNLTTSTG